MTINYLDRINNNGNYERGNLRWTDRTSQNLNQRIRKDNKTGFRGVHLMRGKYVASICINGNSVHLGRFEDKIEAAKAYDKYAIDNNTEHQLNFEPTYKKSNCKVVI